MAVDSITEQADLTFQDNSEAIIQSTSTLIISPEIIKIVPETKVKQKIFEHLKSKESSGLSWTAVVVGGYRDSMYDIPGLFGIDLSEKTLTVYDGGEEEFEVTTMEQVKSKSRRKPKL